jgi:hypothetical protein
LAFVNECNEKQLRANIVWDDPLKRQQMIAIAAYLRAEKRGFLPNNELADWFEAEHEIDRHLNSFSS